MTITNGFTTKNIIITNAITKESMIAGTSQKFTKSVLMKILINGEYADFLTKAYNAEYGDKDVEFDIKYKNGVLYLGEFAYLKYDIID